LNKLFFSFLFFIIVATGNAQDSCHLRISLLTCTPGSELYSIFGHSALRVVDRSTGTDIVYNYGTFEFDDPAFYSKFIRGKLLYFLSQQNFADFQYDYQMDNRGIDEQPLQLDCKQLGDIQHFLFNNLQANNKYYKYDFLLDNCTTRIRDIVEPRADSSMKSVDIPEARGMSFRNAIHFYLDRGKMYWSKLGIDLLLGKKIDRKMTSREAMFLPEFLEKGLDSTTSEGRKLVTAKYFPVTKAEIDGEGRSLFTPMLVFSLFALAIFLLGLSHSTLAQKIVHSTDIVLFLLIGLLGCLILFMWFGTDHRDTGDNLNILWAWPTHVVAAVMLIFRKKIIPNYFLAYSIVTLIIIISWPFLPQQLNPSIVPILAIAAWRSWKITKGLAR
jgi:hypothetical protein